MLAILTACSLSPPSANSASDSIATSSSEVRRANVLLRQGKKLEAASVYYKASLKQVTPHKERLVLQAAEIASSAKDKPLAMHYLSKLANTRLNPENSARRSYVKALIALLDNHRQAALKLLPKQRGAISGNLWSKIQRVRQQIIKQSGGGNFQGSQTVVLPNNTHKIAVLLPLSGKLGKVGRTILKGIEATKTNSSSGGIQIKSYDVASSDVVTQYKLAVKQGADVIIGPLDKRRLARLISKQPNLSRPIISLNHLSAGNVKAPAALYQFGLAPEDEAHQVANFAISRGQKRALVLYPDSSWGKRLGLAFKRMYTSKGGTILTEKAYPNRSGNYKQVLKGALDSAGISNIDMIFLAAAPSQARLIRPTLQYLKVDRIPVYATSHIYSGQPNAGRNMDLNGIIYTEIPYILEGSQIGAVNASSGKYPRLYAMGADAFMIAKNLKKMVQSRRVLSGGTGMIRLGGNRFLQRQLSWATFKKGRTTPYGE